MIIRKTEAGSVCLCQNAVIVDEFVGWRPIRGPLRLEKQTMQFSSGNLQVSIVRIIIIIIIISSILRNENASHSHSHPPYCT
jgi:hypothetical protein